MLINISHDIFIAGTGTDVGKTFVSALILRDLIQAKTNAAYFKAAMSGNVRDSNNYLIPGDAFYVKNISGTKQTIGSMCPYVYENAYSPHLAAQIEGNAVDIEVVVENFNNLKKNYDIIVVEGSGGVLCPIRFDANKKIWLEDIIKTLKLSCILVADAGLGSINSVGLSAEYIKARNISLEGIILNRFDPNNIIHKNNLEMCEYVTGSRVIACVEEVFS